MTQLLCLPYLAKAFDFIPHLGVIVALKEAGVVNSLLEWFADYLSNRSQSVTESLEAS